MKEDKAPGCFIPHPSGESGRQESNLPCTAYQTVASPFGFGPQERPVRESNPSHLLDRRTGTPASSQGHEECPAGVAPAYPTRQVGAWAARPRTQKQGRKESNPLRQGWSLTALPGAHPCQSAEGTGLEPARACASPGFQPGAIMPVGSPFRSTPLQRQR